MTNLALKSVQNGSTSRRVKSKSEAVSVLFYLFIDELKDLYWSERELTIAIPKMIKNATSNELVEALTAHLEETNTQIIRLEKTFLYMGERPIPKKCAAMEDFTKQVDEIIQEIVSGVVLDVAIISVCQKVEHYEIATYGTLASLARILREEEVASLLEETLLEEKISDKKLSVILDLFNLFGEDE